MKEEKKSTIYPEEMPAGENKKFEHGVIVDVVQHEINPTSATAPAQPNDTDSINTEFAKKVMENNL